LPLAAFRNRSTLLRFADVFSVPKHAQAVGCLFSLAHIVISTEAPAEWRNPFPQCLLLIDEVEGDF
jgi:hypothetical protein